MGINIEVINDNLCIDMMNKFIEENPVLWNEDIGEE
jgi:cytosine deaminase